LHQSRDAANASANTFQAQAKATEDLVKRQREIFEQEVRLIIFRRRRSVVVLDNRG
jgi:hypothetical protein